MRLHRAALVMASIFLAVHLAATLLLHAAGLVSNLLITSAAALAALCCLQQRKRCVGFVCTKWKLLAMSLLFWTIGQTLFTYSDAILHVQQTTALTSDFYFFLWGVPALLAIAAADDYGDSTALLILDSVQALLAVILTYLQLFAVKTVAAPGAVGSKSLMYLYLGESLVLAGAASLRLLAQPARQERQFYRVLCLFLWVYALVSIPANYADVFLNVPSGTPFDVLWDIPFLVLICCLLPQWAATSRPKPSAPAREHQTVTALIIYNACPALFTIAVLILAAHVGRERFYIGIAAMSITLFTYTLRAALLQMRYMQAQRALMESDKALREANDRLQEISFSDALTGIANRRRFEQVLETEWNRALRTGASLSLLMIDVDHFKQINDQYGHLHGDSCLIAVARSLAGNLRRGGELLARYGGEEFVAILPNVDHGGAFALAETLRFAVMELSGSAANAAAEHRLTVSIGACSIQPANEHSAAAMVAAADAAMYRAKRLGRNRTEVFLEVVPVDDAVRLLV